MPTFFVLCQKAHSCEEPRSKASCCPPVHSDPACLKSYQLVIWAYQLPQTYPITHPLDHSTSMILGLWEAKGSFYPFLLPSSGVPVSLYSQKSQLKPSRPESGLKTNVLAFSDCTYGHSISLPPQFNAIHSPSFPHLQCLRLYTEQSKASLWPRHWLE